LIVFVGETNSYSLSIKVQDLNKPNGDGYGNASFYSLAEGMNKLKIKNKSSVQKGTATKNGTSVSMSGWKNVVAYLDNPVTSSTKVYAVAYNGDKTEVSF
jgi:hypothetical protein